MLYAKVVLGLPVEGPFDYQVSPQSENNISVGARVWVNFRNAKKIAYVVGLSHQTKIKKIKEIVALIDNFPVLNEAMLLLTKRLAQYYCSSWGQMLEAALPDGLRKGKKLPKGDVSLVPWDNPEKGKRPLLPLFVRGLDRMPVYLSQIKRALALKKSVIILCINAAAAQKFKEAVFKHLGQEVIISYRKQPAELSVWEKIRGADYCIVAGTRSAIFAPVNNLGLIIIDQEEDAVYKQEQAPHYHARQAGLVRAEMAGAKIILGSHCLSLEGFYLNQKGLLDIETIPLKPAYPQVKVIDLRRLPFAERKNNPIFSKFLLDAIQAALTEKGKVLIVINRKGFATTVACHNCKQPLKCPRCNINLVFHFEEDKLKCHHCNFGMPLPKICPHCNAGYIKYFGLGTEKVENELARIFPQARIGEDILVTTGAVINRPELKFSLAGVLAVDNALNRVDLAATEKIFYLLSGVVSLSAKKVIIQSANVNHHIFQALINNDPEVFYQQELKSRKQLGLPPYKHMVLLKIRGAELETVKKNSQEIFQRLNNIKSSPLKLLSLGPGEPAKLRGNFYYQILMRTANLEKSCNFLKLHLNKRHSLGIIVTVDVDPA